jgi:hypothetical protein
MISILLLIVLSFFDARVTFEHNPNNIASREFKFRKIASPSKDDAAANSKLTLIDGDLDGSSGSLATLVDGRVPQDEDEPGGNIFFRAGSTGGRFRMDFSTSIDIAQINSYSWHPNSRGPQLYKVYGADGSEPNVNLDPKRGVDPASCGWKLIALVSTLPDKGDDGGQYAASVADVGKYRYLLFDVYVTELYDNWGNTFYSEIDVISRR